MKKAIIVQGGWDGHEPELVSKRFKEILEKEGFEATIYDTLEVFEDLEYLKGLDLIVACWTMGEISNNQCNNVSLAVAGGVGLAGCHGGMCDSFRQSVQWQFMTGGQWVSHPGGDGVEYTVDIKHSSSSITEGLEAFEIKSEHYYLHVDPAVEVLATTTFPIVPYYHLSNKKVDMPVVWTKMWGNGRVFYNSLGHHDDVFDQAYEAQEIMRRGMLWSARGKEIVVEKGLTTKRFESDKKMY